MALNVDDGSSLLFTPSPASNKFQTFLNAFPSSPPHLRRTESAGRQPSKPKVLHRRPRPGFAAIHSSFYQSHKSATVAQTHLATTMTIEIPSDPQQGILKPVHINTEGAPWTISIAENDAASFSIYVKSTYDGIVILSTTTTHRSSRSCLIQRPHTISLLPAHSRRLLIFIAR